jgi:hypothetical protein
LPKGIKGLKLAVVCDSNEGPARSVADIYGFVRVSTEHFLCGEIAGASRRSHVGAIRDGEFVQIVREDGPVWISLAFLERRLVGRIDKSVVHSTKRLEERAALIDYHGIDVEPFAVPTSGLVSLADSAAGRKMATKGRV